MVGSSSSTNTVGPTTNTKTASTAASTMLMLDSHWMPRATPDTADSTKQIVSTTMISTSTVVPNELIQPASCIPVRICNAPMPSEAAEPNSVANSASTSISRPIGPSTRRLPSSGRNAELISWLRPRR